MSGSTTQDQWLDTVLGQLRALDGVECESLEDGRIRLKISRNGDTREAFLAAAADDYRTQKIRYSQLQKTLTAIGIEEGLTFVAAKPSRRAMTPQMQAARAQQKKTFDAWQDVWRTLRKAEKALDVEYEIAQMKDYY